MSEEIKLPDIDDMIKKGKSVVLQELDESLSNLKAQLEHEGVLTPGEENDEEEV